MSKFGRALLALRLSKGLTLEEMARKIGSHKGYISGFENAKVKPPSAKMLRRIAKLFSEIPLEAFLELAWVEKAPKEIQPKLLELIAQNPLLKIEMRPAEIVGMPAGKAAV